MTEPRSAVVTGAAQGIGRAVVRAFVARGWRVTALDVDLEGVQALEAELPGVTAGQLDVTDAAAWERVLAGVGTVDVLVNNAGVLLAGAFVDLPVAGQAHVVDVNLKGVLHGCAAVFPHLRRPGGVVVNLASASALYGQPGLAVYAATKSAVCALTEALDLEWEQYGLQVVDVLPMYVATHMGEQAVGLPSTQHLGIRLTPEDVAQAVVAAARTGRRPGRGPHRPVGWQARALATATQVSPWALTRQVVGRLAR